MKPSQQTIFLPNGRSCWTFVLLLLIAIAVTAGCRSDLSDQKGLRTFVDGLGNEVRVPERMKRIVTLAPGVTEMVVAAGGLPKIVGVSNADDYPEAILRLPNFAALPVNIEAVAALEPDVVFATSQVNDARDAAAFANLGIPAFFLKSNRLTDIFASIRQISEILGTQDEASAVTDSLEKRVLRLADLTRDLQRPTVLFLISYEALHSFGPESYIHELIQIAGGVSITETLDVENPILSDEFVLSEAPEVIVGTFGDDFRPSLLLEAHPTWTLLPAVQQDRVYSIDGDLVLRAGPRNVDGAEALFGLLHPAN